jgi:hypothetical protein
MSMAARSRLSPLPLVWALVCVAAYGVALFSIPWPYVDAYNNLNEASRWTWRQYFPYAFGAGTEYRPLLVIMMKVAYEIVGLRLWVYQALVLLQFAAVLGLVIWLFRPRGTARGVAAAIALACLAGLHPTRILFAFLPLNAHSAALVFVLAAVALAFEPRTRAFDWVFFPLMIVGALVLESTLLIVPLLIVLWWRGAPGVSARGVAAMAAGVIVYAAVRITFGTIQSESIYTGSGLGFAAADPETLRSTFEHAPWLYWTYNVVATLLTVAASEPRAGVYAFVANVLHSETPWWQWWHVGSSVLTTIVIATVLIRRRIELPRDRLLLACGLVLIVCGSALGFLYTRDRIALSAGVGYCLLLYVALAAMLEHVRASAWRHTLVLGIVGVVGVGWIVRSAEAYFQLRDIAWDFHLEWTTRYADLGGPAQPQGPLITSMRSMALSHTPADPGFDPAWTYTLFERRYAPHGSAPPRPAEVQADNAVPALSLPFDIRWAGEVDDATRAKLEADLGLMEGQPVARDERGRTWTYRMRYPTQDRIRTVLRHPLVEDTARIDAARLEIVD